MHDIKFIRNYPEEFEKLMRRRGLDIKSSFILEIDTSIRGYQTEFLFDNLVLRYQFQE